MRPVIQASDGQRNVESGCPSSCTANGIEAFRRDPITKMDHVFEQVGLPHLCDQLCMQIIGLRPGEQLLPDLVRLVVLERLGAAGGGAPI
jgi:hypothetical protein